LDICQSNDVVALGVDRGELDSVSLSWGVIEVSGTGVDAVVAEVIEDNDVAWKSLFQWNLLTHPRLLIRRSDRVTWNSDASAGSKSPLVNSTALMVATESPWDGADISTSSLLTVSPETAVASGEKPYEGRATVAIKPVVETTVRNRRSEPVETLLCCSKRRSCRLVGALVAV